MNREIWSTRTFPGNSTPNYTCPTCGKGTLVLESKVSKITPSGQHDQSIRYPYGIEHLLAGFFRCNNSNCKSLITFVGLSLNDIEYRSFKPSWKVDLKVEMIKSVSDTV